MKSRTLLLALLIASTLVAQEQILLPKPDKVGGKPLYQTLNERKTARNFDASKTLTQEQLSQILWAAQGVNRPDGHRTAPTAWGNNEIAIYIFLTEGIYLYNPDKHLLDRVLLGDHREKAGLQDFVKDAPASLIYVADLDKITQVEEADLKRESALMDVGFTAQNVYLAAASEGLITGARGYIDHPQLQKTLELGQNYIVLLGQSVGYAE